MIRKHLQNFKAARALAESYDPTSAGFDSPGIAQLAGQFKRAALGHNPDDEAQNWDTHLNKETARAQLLGRIHDAFPHLDHAGALDVAARHMKVGRSPKYEQLAALAALFKSRDNSERGISFGTPFHAVRAGGFCRALKCHYPSMDYEIEHFPEAGVTLVSFPEMEHLPPQLEEPPEASPPAMEVPEVPSDETLPDDVGAEEEPAADEWPEALPDPSMAGAEDGGENIESVTRSAALTERRQDPFDAALQDFLRNCGKPR